MKKQRKTNSFIRSKHFQDNLYSSALSGVEGIREWLRIPENEPVTSVLFGGFIGSLFSLLQYLNAPILGALSDKVGRRPVIMARVRNNKKAGIIKNVT